MNQTSQVFSITFAIISIGFLLKKYNFISEKDGKVVSKFLMHTTFPALMITSTARVDLEPTLFLIPFLCIVFCGIMMGIAWIWFRQYPNDLRGILTMGAGGMNVGLFGFPIIEGLFGKAALVYAVMFDIGNTIVVFGLVYPIGSYFSNNKVGELDFKTILKKVLSLPPVLGLILGLTINAIKLPVPTIFMDVLDVMAKANKPLVLLLMGIYLSFELSKKQVLALSKVLLIRYSVALLLVFVLYNFLPAHSLLQSVLIICVVLPIGMTILPFSDELNYDSRLAGTLLNMTLIISFILMWALVLGLDLV